MEREMDREAGEWEREGRERAGRGEGDREVGGRRREVEGEIDRLMGSSSLSSSEAGSTLTNVREDVIASGLLISGCTIVSEDIVEARRLCSSPLGILAILLLVLAGLLCGASSVWLLG